jgi:hypothetical protein
MRVNRPSRRHILPILAAAAGLAVLTTGCVLPDYAAFLKGAESSEVARTSSQIVLAWDPPSTPVSSYEVYFRVHGDSSWTKLGEAAATATPEFTVLHSDVGSGVFDFAVVSRNDLGLESDMHTSLDATADPTTGWYLRWE